jgi:hypothetical protein
MVRAVGQWNHGRTLYAGGLTFRPRHTDQGSLVSGSLARRDAGGSDVDRGQAGSAALR